MIKITLFKDIGGWGFVMATEVTNMRRRSSETNKLRDMYEYVHSIGGTPRDIAIKEREIA